MQLYQFFVFLKDCLLDNRFKCDNQLFKSNLAWITLFKVSKYCMFWKLTHIRKLDIISPSVVKGKDWAETIIDVINHNVFVIFGRLYLLSQHIATVTLFFYLEWWIDRVPKILLALPVYRSKTHLALSLILY